MSSPKPRAACAASASPVTIAIRNVLTASFISRPLGTWPVATISRHIGASRARTSSTAAGSPASIATSRPASAGWREPDTGAST